LGKISLIRLRNIQTDKRFSPRGDVGLVSQMRRAAISIAANIVEGSKRLTNKDWRHFLIMAETSLEETKYYIILTGDLKYAEEEKLETLIDKAREIGRMITGLSKSLSQT
jgi:four helix bundle protein